MDTRNLLRERLRRSRDWVAAIDELEKELEASGTKLEQSERLYELAALVEDVIPERERALGLYQRAWKLYPDNLKALSRAREVYGEIGRFEMVAKLGEMELRSPMASTNLAQIVGEALLDSGQKDKALPVLQRAIERTPDSVRVQDALSALDYEPEFWTDAVDLILEKVDRAPDDVLAARMLLKAARIVRFEAPEDPRLEELLKRTLAKDIDEPSANFIYETLLSTTNRWDELEAHHRRRAERATDHTKRVEALRTFALEWVQRFKDRDRGAKFFDEAMKATVANGSMMRSPVAAFSLLCQVQGQRGEWAQLLELADRVLDRLAGEDKLFIAIQAGQIAFDKANDIERARRFFAIAARIEPKNPSVQEFIEVVGLPEGAAPAPEPAQPEPSAAGSMPMQVIAAEEPRDRVVRDTLPEPARPAPVAVVEAPLPEPARPEPVVAAEPSRPAPVAVVEAPRPAPVAAVEPARPAVSGDLGDMMKAARAAESGADKGIPAWKDLIAKHPQEKAPRRELARVLRANGSWAQLADALKDEEAKASASGPEKADVFLELAEVYGKLTTTTR